jgi:hypothetical protein
MLIPHPQSPAQLVTKHSAQMNGVKLSPKLPDIRVLNEGDGKNEKSQSATDISKSLQKLMLR